MELIVYQVYIYSFKSLYFADNMTSDYQRRHIFLQIKIYLKKALLLSVILHISFFHLLSQNMVKPGIFVTEPPTLENTGFEWYIEGDENRNSRVSVEYREKGENKWKQAMDLLRLGGEQAGIKEWNYITPEMFAGSVFNLKPGTTYEFKFAMKDPDGISGDSIQLISHTTRAIPRPFQEGEIRHVFPEHPSVRGLAIRDSLIKAGEKVYKGLIHAYYGYPRYADWILTTDPVEAGDILLLHEGEYRASPKIYRDFYGVTFDGIYHFTQDGTVDRPIVIQSAGDGEVIFDGGGNHNLFDITAGDYHIIEGITFRNTEFAIIAGKMNMYGCNGLTVRNCRFEDIGIGIHGVYEGSRDYLITDNYFIGREDTTAIIKTRGVSRQGTINQVLFSYYAVKVHGQGHVISHNLVKWFFDGIDICTHSMPEKDQSKKSVSIDIHNNDIFLCNDNFIEADGGMHNIRIYKNRAYNAGQAGFSSQPALGGPVYWIRNIGINTPFSSAMKWWGMNPAGVLVYHNSFTTFNTRYFNPASNIHFRNNIFFPPQDDASYGAFAFYTYTGYSTSDFNAYHLNIGMVRPFMVTLPDKPQEFDLPGEITVFKNLNELRKKTGLEKHGMYTDAKDFVRIPSVEYSEFFKKYGVHPLVHPHRDDFKLVGNSGLIDKGVLLPNINDHFKGAAPDIGAFEYGESDFIYGPRDARDALY